MSITKTIPWVYLILALLVAIPLSPLPYSVIAAILILAHIYYLYRPCSANLNLVLTFSTLFIMPLTLQPVVGEFFAALFAIPALPLLDHSLKEFASNQDLYPSETRKPTPLLGTLSIAIIVVLTVSLILANWTLSLTSAILVFYFIAVLGYILYSIPKAPLQVSNTRVRIIAGNTSNISIIIKNKSKRTLHTLCTSPYPWISIDPDRLEITKRHETRINLTLTPPLSGASKPQIQAYITDPWGLIQINQNLEPVEMYVIPRAKYATWLANRFLGQSMLQITPTVTATTYSKTPIATRRGVEYINSRPYQPGDKLKDLDWKHMSKLNELVVKGYIEDTGQSVIIAVNLTVKDPEEADKLIYNLITLTLTLAKDTVQAALVAYNQNEILLTTETMNPREILKEALKLEQDVVIVEPGRRFLQPPDIRRLRRTLNQLEQAKTEPAQKILNFLRFEYEAIQERAKSHPAGRAIVRATEYVQSPATIAVLSGWNHDTEALPAILDRLEGQGYNIIKV